MARGTRRRSRARLFTGDLLFVGGVGRPDLLGDAQTRELADQLFDSLQRVMRLERRRRSASRTWRRIALRRRHRQGTLVDDRARARD